MAKDYDLETDCAIAEKRWANPRAHKFRWRERRNTIKQLTPRQRADVYALLRSGYTFNMINFMRGYAL